MREARRVRLAKGRKRLQDSALGNQERQREYLAYIVKRTRVLGAKGRSRSFHSRPRGSIKGPLTRVSPRYNTMTWRGGVGRRQKKTHHQVLEFCQGGPLHYLKLPCPLPLPERKVRSHRRPPSRFPSSFAPK